MSGLSTAVPELPWTVEGARSLRLLHQTDEPAPITGHTMMDSWRRVFCTSLLLISAALPTHAQWLQWGGPNRDFKVNTTGLADQWPDEGPRRLWQRDLGDGYSTILRDGDRLYTMYRAGQDEFTIALDEQTGKTCWEHRNPSPTNAHLEENGAGPHSTPLIVADRLYTVGTNAILHCYAKQDGRILWKHDLAADFGGRVPSYGYACSPLAYNDTIILSVVSGGGTEAEGSVRLVAINGTTGTVAWQGPTLSRTFSKQEEYSSPITITIGGQDQLVYLTNEVVAGFNPAAGTQLWSFKHPSRTGVNVSMPVWNGADLIFCSSAYDAGARVLQLRAEGTQTKVEELWYSRKMRMHHGNAVLIGEYVYGSSGDFGPAFFAAANVKTGTMAWRERGFSKATCVYGDGKLIILDEDGQLALARVSPESLTVLSKCQVAQRSAWTAPTLVGQTLYVRDRRQILALDLGKSLAEAGR